jgi:hypothetical protein
MRSSVTIIGHDVVRGIAQCVVIVAAALAGSGRQAGRADEPSTFQTETLQGRVVYLADALEQKFAIKTSPEARERILALETKEGDLVPLVEDLRGRSFRADKRLRNMNVELTVRRYAGSPVVQVIRVCELAKDGKLEVDYWCSTCSIAMFELKECECCQGPIELRKRKVEK